MSGATQLALRPELCDRCGKCVTACPEGRLRIGAGYIYVDASGCTGCHACVDACGRGAILRRTAASGKAVVGSRAEAKRARELAAAGEKARIKVRVKSSTPQSAARVDTAQAREKDARPARAAVGAESGANWTLADAAAVAAVLLATLAAKESVLGSAAVSVMPPTGRVMARIGVLGVFYLAQIVLLAFLARRHGMRAGDAFRLTGARISARDAAVTAGLVAALLVATRAFSTAWGAVSQGLGWSPPASDALVQLFGGGGAGLALAVAMVVVVAPLVEELAFRGVIAGAMGARFGVPVAVAGSATIFAAYHLTAWVLVPTFALGCALGWLALTRRTLWPAIALHVLYNGIVVAAVFWLPGG